jgi:hypothetical protein
VRVESYHLRDLDKLDHVQPAVATLVFRDEGLGPPEPLRQLSLREAGLLPMTNAQVTEQTLAIRQSQDQVDAGWRRDCRPRGSHFYPRRTILSLFERKFYLALPAAFKVRFREVPFSGLPKWEKADSLKNPARVPIWNSKVNGRA